MMSGQPRLDRLVLSLPGVVLSLLFGENNQIFLSEGWNYFFCEGLKFIPLYLRHWQFLCFNAG